MQRLTTTLVLAAMAFTLSGTAEAARRNPYVNRPVVVSQPRTGFFARMMELERAKNERLRQMFFGR